MSSTPAAATAGASIPLYAGFWRRVAAYSVDSIVVLAGAALILVPSIFSDALAMIGPAIVLVFYFGYFPAMHASALQATLGKLLLDIKVTDREGNRIGMGRSLGRLLGMFVVSSVLTLGVGYALAGVTQRREALHDMISGTLVVSRAAAPAQIVAGGRPMPITVGVWATLIGLIVASLLFNVVSWVYFPD